MAHIDIQPDYQGKVRDIYDLGDKLLLVTSDRISAFDYILPDEIPYKGQVLTQISVFWFEFLENVCKNHLISTDVKDLPSQFAPFTDYLNGRFMLVKKVSMFPVECIVRGYLVGSGYAEYVRSGSVCGIALPEGILEAEKLETSLFTPSTKAEIGDHDENISFAECAQLIGEKDAQSLKDLSCTIYERARDYALSRGIIIADTKFEFGRNGEDIILADEVLTPDSSRFWPEEAYELGKSQQSFDKQYVRDWLSGNWDRTTPPPHLPADVIEKTSEKYICAYEKLTQRKFSF